jgi:hypothetical protein
LVEVAHEQVRAAGVAQLADLGEQPGHRDVRIRGQPAAQVLAVGVDQRAAVARWPLQLLGGGGAGVALDRVQRPTQPARAVQQAHTLVEQFVHGRMPGPGPLVDHPHRSRRLLRLRSPRKLCAPAGAVGDDGLLHCTAQAVPQVPAVADLHRVWCALADGLGVGSGAVAADDLGSGMLTQPRGQRGGLAIGQHIHPLMGDRVDQHGGVVAAAAERDVVDAEHRRLPVWAGSGAP